MKTAVIGAEGFLGCPLFQAYRQLYPDCIGTTRHRKSKGLSYYDLSNPSIEHLKLKESGHEAAIITAALTKIKDCENDKEWTNKINEHGTLSLIRQLWEKDVFPIFLSSVHVFGEQSKQVFTEEEELNPDTQYGKTKAAIEIELKNSGQPFLIVRLGKVLGFRRGDETLLDEMASLLVKGRPVYAAYDQTLNPIGVDEVVKAILELQEAGVRGLINMCSSETWTRYDLALAVAEALGCDKGLVKKISLDDLSLGYSFPKNVSMSNNRLRDLVKFKPVLVEEYIRKTAANWKKEGI